MVATQRLDMTEKLVECHVLVRNLKSKGLLLWQ